MSEPDKAAANWLARRGTGQLSDADRVAFETWLAKDVANRIAFAEAERAVDVAKVALDDQHMWAWRDNLMNESPRRALLRGAIAAGVAVFLLGGGGLLAVEHLTGPKPLATQAFRTAVGQRSTVTLPDGSTVTLNTDTVVRTRADGQRRLVYLDKGQAYFRVAKNPRRPFVVTAAGRTVTALGTAFDVRVDGRALRVVLVEGKVRVEGAPAPGVSPAGDGKTVETITDAAATDVQATEMLPGSVLVAPEHADWRLGRANTARETSWVRGQIIFDNEPLGAVVAELNRYSDVKMVVDDPSLSARPISGAFKPGDVRGFARLLEGYRYASVVRKDDSTIHFEPVK